MCSIISQNILLDIVKLIWQNTLFLIRNLGNEIHSLFFYYILTGSSSVTEDWSASTFNGVDWKSLCLPPCLPLTIHYFPEDSTLQNQYYENNYTMVMEPDEIGPDGEMIRKEVISVSRFDRTALSPEKKFMEMISQRISKVSIFFFDPILLLRVYSYFSDSFLLQMLLVIYS